MADAAATQILHEDASSLTVLLTNVSDGTGEADVIKVDVSALAIPCARVTIDEYAFATDGMAVRLEWHATADVVALLLPANQSGRIDCRGLGLASGIANPMAAGANGDLKATTVGHTAGDTYWIVLVLRKHP